MKALFLLFVVITDNQGNENLLAVSEIKHNSLISCYAEKAHYQDLDNKLKFFCADKEYFKQHQNEAN
jgi:hypothetical protein